MEMLGSHQGSPLTGAGTSASVFHTPEHMLPMPGLMQGQSGQKPSPFPGPSLPRQHQEELQPCEEGFLLVLCEMENTPRPAPPTHMAWVQHQHVQPGDISKQRGKTQ